MKTLVVVGVLFGTFWLPGPVRLLLGWAIFVYLAWRAWPAVRRDLDGLPALRSLRRPRARGKYEGGRL